MARTNKRSRKSPVPRTIIAQVYRVVRVASTILMAMHIASVHVTVGQHGVSIRWSDSP